MSEQTRGTDWMRGAQRDAVQEGILAVAEEVFAELGPDASMAQISSAVGCSRATLYRYFDGRTQLQLAYVERVARRIGAEVSESVAGVADARERLTESIVAALDRVRQDRALAVWFVPRGAGVTTELALSSELIESAAAAFLGSGAPDNQLAARWVIRVIVSLLTVPGESNEQERLMISQFVTPAVISVIVTGE